jgi:hypothetical protein
MRVCANCHYRLRCRKRRVSDRDRSRQAPQTSFSAIARRWAIASSGVQTWTPGWRDRLSMSRRAMRSSNRSDGSSRARAAQRPLAVGLGIHVVGDEEPLAGGECAFQRLQAGGDVIPGIDGLADIMREAAAMSSWSYDSPNSPHATPALAQRGPGSYNARDARLQSSARLLQRADGPAPVPDPPG